MRLIVRYHGRVQGVGFRATVRSIARGQPVTGFVRNEPDGTVCMEAQGSPGAIDVVRAEVRGAMTGFITREEANETAEITGESGFFIAR